MSRNEWHQEIVDAVNERRRLALIRRYAQRPKRIPVLRLAVTRFTVKP